ncbi:hypothetical protein [Asaia bogorensis]|uniref:hypothetical protein n=1 Tax=Asaia bogorensis TaxID=91915 RepID=UPI00197C6552|nr:hypothetical protein [Asaia bogorensis]
MTRLPTTLRLGSDILLVHGTATSDPAYFLETVAVGSLRPATRAEIVARLIQCDHTHIQRMVAFGKGRLVLNPGSVGLLG